MDSHTGAMECHSCYLKDLYKECEGMHLKWLPVFMNDFVSVLCIESAKEPDEKVTEEMVLDMLIKQRK